MEQDRERFKHLLIILLEALAGDPARSGELQSRVQEEAAAAGLDAHDVNQLLDWIESQWNPEDLQEWPQDEQPEAPSPGAFRYFGLHDVQHLSGASLGYILRLLQAQQITRAQLESLVQYASYLAVRPIEPEDLDSILEQVIFRPAQPRMTGGASEGFGSVH